MTSVLFVCVKNGGKSQMAAGLMRAAAGDIAVSSAGTRPGSALNALSVDSLREVGIDISGQTPQALTPELMAAADLVVTLGREAHVGPVDGTPMENWDTDEPSERGIEGIGRMRLVRDDITARVGELAERLRTGERGPGSLPAPVTLPCDQPKRPET